MPNAKLLVTALGALTSACAVGTADETRARVDAALCADHRDPGDKTIPCKGTFHQCSPQRKGVDKTIPYWVSLEVSYAGDDGPRRWTFAPGTACADDGDIVLTTPGKEWFEIWTREQRRLAGRLWEPDRTAHGFLHVEDGATRDRRVRFCPSPELLLTRGSQPDSWECSDGESRRPALGATPEEAARVRYSGESEVRIRYDYSCYCS